jgi:hypothetical protein
VFSLQDAFWSLVLPALIAATVSIVGWQPWRRIAPVALWIAPVAIALAFIFAFPGINFGHWEWPVGAPRESSAWLPWVAIVALIAGLASATLWQARWIVTVLVFVLSFIACRMFLKFQFTTETWSFGFGTMMVGIFAIVSTAWWMTLEQAREESPLLAELLIGISIACVALTLMLTGSKTYGQFGLAIGFAAAGLLPALLWRPTISLRGLPAVFSVMLVPILTGGYYLSSLPLALFLILSSTPLFIALGILLPSRLTGWKRILLRLALAFVPLATATIIAAAQFKSPNSQSDDSGYYQ